MRPGARSCAQRRAAHLVCTGLQPGLYGADVKLQPLLHRAAGVTNVPRCAAQRAWAAACVRGLARGTPAEVLVVGARERAVVVEDDTVSDHFAVPPVPHPVVRQEDVPGYLGLQPGKRNDEAMTQGLQPLLLRQRGVLRRVKEAGKVIVEARRNHARAAEDPVKRTGVHAQPLLPEEERYRAAASQGDYVLKGLPCLGQSCCTTCRAWRHLRMRAEAAGCRLLPRGPVWVGGCRARAGRRVARSASLRVGRAAPHGPRRMQRENNKRPSHTF